MLFSKEILHTTTDFFIENTTRKVSEIKDRTFFVDIQREGEKNIASADIYNKKPTIILTARPNEFKNKKALILNASSPIDMLASISSEYRDKINPIVVGVVGSIGKTSTTQIINHIIKNEQNNVLINDPNENDELGVPILILNSTKDTRIIVTEMASWRKGEIHLCCTAAKPIIGVYTRLDEVHLSRFGNIKNIIDAKLELAKYISAHNGKMVLNASDDLFFEHACNYSKDYISYGIESPSSDVFVKDIIEHNKKWTVNVCCFGEDYLLENIKPSNGFLENCLASLCVAYLLNIPFYKSVKYLSDSEPRITSRNEIVFSNNQITIIDDTCNASVKSCMELSQFVANSFNCMKYIIYGGMLETGKDSQRLNDKAIDSLISVFDRVIIIDEKIQIDKVDDEKVYTIKKEMISKYLVNEIKLSENQPIVVAFKGSAGTGIKDCLDHFCNYCKKHSISLEF